MCKGTSIQIRLTRNQKDRTILAMQNAGYNCMSTFVRNLILQHDLSSQKMIQEIYELMKGGVKDGQNKDCIQG